MVKSANIVAATTTCDKSGGDIINVCLLLPWLRKIVSEFAREVASYVDLACLKSRVMQREMWRALYKGRSRKQAVAAEPKVLLGELPFRQVVVTLAIQNSCDAKMLPEPTIENGRRS